MARVIRMQGYKDWKDGLITTEEMLKGNVHQEPLQVREMWLRIIARATGNWENVPHHDVCCCDVCAPTEEEKKLRVELHNSALDLNARGLEAFSRLGRSAFDKSQTLEELIMTENVMANATMSEVDHDPLCCCEICIDEMFELDPENLAPSDCEE